jgi:superfamily II DNA or RNA helicase
VQIIDNRALQFVTRKADQITALIPKSKVLARNGDQAKILVNWGHVEAKLLRNLQIKNVPHPITGRYKWPGVYTPFDHQRTTAAFLATHPRCLVLSEAGTGKTSAAAWAADYLMLQGEIKRVLIVCPVSIMDTAWRADLFRTLMHRTVAIATGSKAKRQQLINGDYEFVIINFDGVKVVREELAAGGFDLVIVDEATAVKSTTTDRWKALYSLIKPTTRLWLMTGTPASQSPTDAYGLAKLVNPSAVPKFFGAFRDLVMYKITNFKWAPKTTAQDTVFKVLQPAIRFTKAECLDLPDLLYTTRDIPLTVQQMKYYEEVRKSMVAVAAGSEITAVNAAGLLNKLLQISCIAYNTEVLTDAGWIPIQLVTPQHHVWDGVEWVSQQGAIFRGVKPLVAIAGVRMTAEHKVLTNDGWATADDILKSRSSGIRLDWAKVRFPDGTGASSISPARHSVCKMGVPVRLRSDCGAAEPVSSQYEARASKKLWVPPRERNAQNDTGTPVSHMVRYAAEMFRPKRQRLPKLWSAWDNCVQTLGGFFRELLGRHAGGIRRELDAGSDQRRGAVQPKELSMGYGYGASQQYTVQPLDRYAKRAYDCGAGRTGLRAKDGDPKCTTETLRLAAGESPHYAGTERVYDLLNCGPRSRFVVRGHNGEHLIVHNCGAAYTTDREVIEFDVSNRVNELLDVIEQTTHKVIVFVPFRHALEMLEQALAKAGIATESIHGGVSAGQRAESIKRFQTEERPKALLLIPQAAAHGITLTKADTVVWWGPVPSAELYLQGNARAHRAGQVNKVTVVRLQGSPVERRVYAMLDGKVDLHQGLVDLYRQEIA